MFSWVEFSQSITSFQIWRPMSAERERERENEEWNFKCRRASRGWGSSFIFGGMGFVDRGPVSKSWKSFNCRVNLKCACLRESMRPKVNGNPINFSSSLKEIERWLGWQECKRRRNLIIVGRRNSRKASGTSQSEVPTVFLRFGIFSIE